MCYYIILRAQLYYFACATILVFVRYYISLRALLHLGSVCYYTSVACATILRLRSVRKWKYIMRFEIRYFFLWIGLSPKGLTKSQEKSFKFQTSLYTITFHGLACVTMQCICYYVGEIKEKCCYNDVYIFIFQSINILQFILEFCSILKGGEEWGAGGPKIL